MDMQDEPEEKTEEKRELTPDEVKTLVREVQVGIIIRSIRDFAMVAGLAIEMLFLRYPRSIKTVVNFEDASASAKMLAIISLTFNVLTVPPITILIAFLGMLAIPPSIVFGMLRTHIGHASTCGVFAVSVGMLVAWMLSGGGIMLETLGIFATCASAISLLLMTVVFPRVAAWAAESREKGE